MKKGEQKALLLVSSPSFIGEVKALRKKWDIPQVGFSNNAELNSYREKLTSAEMKLQRSDVKMLAKGHGLSKRWEQALLWYFYTNSRSLLAGQPPYALKIDEVDPNYIWIRVDADTTQKELADALWEAKNRLPKKQNTRSYPNLEQSIKAKELRESGLTWSAITSRLNEEFDTDYEENYYLKLVKRLKQHL